MSETAVAAALEIVENRMTALTQQNGHGDAMLAKRIADGFSGVAGLYLPAKQHAVSVDTHNLLHALSYVDNAVVYGRNSDTEIIRFSMPVGKWTSLSGFGLRYGRGNATQSPP